MIEVDITDQMRERAQHKDTEMGELRNSIKHGKGNEGGFLGEVVVLFHLPHAQSENTFQHDIRYRGYTFDVKTTERDKTFTAPPDRFVEKISALNPNQQAEFVIFVSLHRKTIAYITGWMHKPLFLKHQHGRDNRVLLRTPGNLSHVHGRRETMSNLLKRILYGRCYSKPSDHFFQDYHWQAWARSQELKTQESFVKGMAAFHANRANVMIGHTDYKNCDGCVSKTTGCNECNIRCDFYKPKPDVVLTPVWIL